MYPPAVQEQARRPENGTKRWRKCSSQVDKKLYSKMLHLKFKEAVTCAASQTLNHSKLLSPIIHSPFTHIAEGKDRFSAVFDFNTHTRYCLDVQATKTA